MNVIMTDTTDTTNTADVGLEADDIWGDVDFGIDFDSMSTDEIRQRRVMIENEIKIFKSEHRRISHEAKVQADKVKENKEKIKLNKQLPYLVGNVVEVLELPKEKAEEAGAAKDAEAELENKSVVVKTSTRQTIYLPIPGLIDPDELKPGELVGTNKDSYLILEKLPVEYDSRVKAMEVDEKPTEDYSDIGGLDKQI